MSIKSQKPNKFGRLHLLARNHRRRLSFFASRKRRDMADKEEKPDLAKVVREQLNRGTYRDALRSRYKPMANEAMTDDLLKRLAAIDAKQRLE